MKNQKQTIRKIVSFLNNSEEDGGFWLPNIQRSFVWSEEQICRLFDSILREYPISTLLVWKTKSEIRHRKFIDNWRADLVPSNPYVPEDVKKKCLVLDGQQRLQSLYIGLCGSFAERELYFDILSDDIGVPPDDIKYHFKFQKNTDAVFPWIKFKELVMTTKKKPGLIKDMEIKLERTFTEREKEQIETNLDLIDRTFKMEEVITYQELDSIDNPELYSDDDVVEIFIRANSGGTKLEKSDLLFSLLNATWDVADDRMEELLGEVNRHGFAFNRDFVLKTCLVLLDQGARYEVSKFRQPGVREAIEKQWSKLGDSIKAVADFVREKTYVKDDKALPSYLALIPLIYVHYHYPPAWKTAKDMDTFLIRTLLSGAFSGQPDQIIDTLVRKIRERNGFDAEECYRVIRDQNRSLEITKDRFFAMGYGSKNIHLIMSLWYQNTSNTPAYDNNLPQIDHIFPQSRLKAIKTKNPETGKPVMKYNKHQRDQLANCMLLTREENGAGGKGDASPAEWFKDKDDAYLERHLIPKDRELWGMDRFDDFIKARKELIAVKFSGLLV